MTRGTEYDKLISDYLKTLKKLEVERGGMLTDSSGSSIMSHVYNGTKYVGSKVISGSMITAKYLINGGIKTGSIVYNSTISTIENNTSEKTFKKLVVITKYTLIGTMIYIFPYSPLVYQSYVKIKNEMDEIDDNDKKD